MWDLKVCSKISFTQWESIHHSVGFGGGLEEKDLMSEQRTILCSQRS